jgi:hypothetical protein
VTSGAEGCAFESRRFLQRDLWAVFDHLVGQNIARFNDPDLARRLAIIPDYQVNTSGHPDNELGPEELQPGPGTRSMARFVRCWPRRSWSTRWST